MRKWSAILLFLGLLLACCPALFAQGTVVASFDGTGSALPTGFWTANSCTPGAYNCPLCSAVANGATTPAGYTMRTYGRKAYALVCSAVHVSGTDSPINAIRIYSGNTCGAAHTGIPGTHCNMPAQDGWVVYDIIEQAKQDAINEVLTAPKQGTLYPQWKWWITQRYPAAPTNHFEGWMHNFASYNLSSGYIYACEDSGTDKTDGFTTCGSYTGHTLGTLGDRWLESVIINHRDTSGGHGNGCGKDEIYKGDAGGPLQHFWNWTVFAPHVTGQNFSLPQTPGCLQGMGSNSTAYQSKFDWGIAYAQAVGAGKTATHNLEIWGQVIKVCIGPTRADALTACGHGELATQ